MVEILDVVFHNSGHRTYTLDIEVDAKPGQFCMLWIPAVNEKPMSLSGIDGNVQITVKKIGKFTQNLFMLDKGDTIGFRGPYGHGFDLVAGKTCLVGGGCGIAPLRPLMKRLKGDVVLSSRDVESLLFENEFSSNGFNVYVSTDDGSKGDKGYAHETFSKLIEKNNYACVYSCGPEPMMAQIMKICNETNIPAQLSLERYMKCGVGICGSCSLSGLRVCKEGPVFDAVTLSKTEFGRWGRDSTGSKMIHDGCR